MLKPKALKQKLLNGTLRHQAARVFFAVLAQVSRSVRTTPVFSYTRGRGMRVAGALVGLALVASLAMSFAKPATSAAATSDNLNFQARLQASSGAIVPDGNYNVEFKLYNASSGGTALWTEDYLNSAGHGIQVINGYLSVNLGSLTSFPGNISWDQDMYVTMNVGGTTTGTPGWDGEMNPRLKLTAVPYAFQAKSATQLQAHSGSGVGTLDFDTLTTDQNILLPNASGTVCLQSSADCGFAASTGGTGYIQNGTSLQGGTNFNIRSTATGSVTAALQALGGQTASLLEFRDQNGAVMSSFGADGSLSVGTKLQVDSGAQGESGLKFAQLNSNSTGSTSFSGILGIDQSGNVGLTDISTVSDQLMNYWNDLAWDTTNNRLGIGNDTPDYKLDVKDSNVGGYVARIQNTATDTSAGDASSSANGLLIQLGTDNSNRTTGNYFIGFAGGTSGAGTIAGKIQGGSGGVAYTTSGADYAEYFKANPSDLPQAGEIVSLDPATSQGVVRGGGDMAPFGIVSAKPGFLGNGPICNVDDANCDKDYQLSNVIVGMNGQLPTKVSVSNGEIKIGDPIMASSTVPGTGVKATGYSRIIGYAEEAATADGVIKVLVQPGIFDPVAATNLQGSGNPLTIDSDLHVTGNTVLEGTLNVGKALNAPSLSVISADVSGDLTVVGTATIGNLDVVGSATIQTLTINGVANFAGDIKLQGQVNTRQATLKAFKASKPIKAGSVVILDNRDGHEGEITTTTSVNDSRVIGVAVTEAAHEGDTIDVAISGWVQVRVDTTPDGNGNAPAGLTAGQLLSTSVGEGTAQTSATPSAGSILGKTTSKQDSNNLVWIMITLQ
jgi:hypothetical protein